MLLWGLTGEEESRITLRFRPEELKVSGQEGKLKSSFFWNDKLEMLIKNPSGAIDWQLYL